MTIRARNLVIELTRRCNMNCDHCLRGCAQAMDVSKDVLKMAAANIKADSVTFTGGEPSLNTDGMSEYFRQARKEDNLPMSFYVVTNGKANQRRLANILRYAYREMADQEFCGLTVSSDVFHDRIEDDATRVFENLPFYKADDKAHPLDEARSKWVINTGRAKELGLGYRDPAIPPSSFDDWVEDVYVGRDGITVVEVDMLYVSANGNIVGECDCSYEHIDEAPLTDIWRIRDDLTQYAEKYINGLPLPEAS